MEWFFQQWANPAFVAYINFVISVLSLIVASYAWLSSHKNSQHLIRIEEERDRKADKSEAKANLSAAIEHPSKNTFNLLIRNKGPGVARDLQIMLDGEDWELHRTVKQQDISKTLVPGATIKITLWVTLSEPKPFRIWMRWSDDSGGHGVFESDL